MKPDPITNVEYQTLKLIVTRKLNDTFGFDILTREYVEQIILSGRDETALFTTVDEVIASLISKNLMKINPTKAPLSQYSLTTEGINAVKDVDLYDAHDAWTTKNT